MTTVAGVCAFPPLNQKAIQGWGTRHPHLDVLLCGIVIAGEMSSREDIGRMGLEIARNAVWGNSAGMEEPRDGKATLVHRNPGWVGLNRLL